MFPAIISFRPFHRQYLVAAELTVDPVRRIVAGVVLVLVTVVVVIHPLSILLGLMLRAFTVNEVLALGLGELVDLGGGEAGKELLSEGVVDGLACWGSAMNSNGEGASKSLPSLRWWSSKALKPAKAAPPAISSWLKLDSFLLSPS